MTYSEAIEILKLHNEWRRGGENSQEPKRIGEAIDTVCRLELAAKALDVRAPYELIGRIATLSYKISDVPRHLDSSPSDGWEELKEVLGI